LILHIIYDILIVDKGKPFERVGHKALEPKSPGDLWLSATRKM